MNSKRDLKNISYTIAGQILVLGLSLVVPRFVLTGYGSDTNGLLSTIGQIVAYMSILEAGIGQATRNELYHFIKGDDSDRKSISSIMALSRRSYRRMTMVYAALAVLLSLIIPFIIKTELDYPTVALVMLIEGTSGVLSFYFVQADCNLLTADGKQYINSNIDLVYKGLIYSVKIIMVMLGMNVIVMEICLFTATFIKLLIYKCYMKKHYKWIDYSSCEDRRLKDRGPYIITEVAWTVFSSTDMIVISIFCSTKSSTSASCTAPTQRSA